MTPTETRTGRATTQASATVVDLDLRRASAVELATRAKAGSDAAFQELARRLNGRINHFTGLYFLPGGERGDLHQEGLLGLHKAARDYRPGQGANFTTFAEICIRRQIMSAVKAATRQKHGPLNRRIDAILDEAEDRGSPFIDGDSDPHDSAVRREELQTLADAASTLTKLERGCLGLILTGYEYSEVAERLGASERSVDNAIQRARRKLSEGMALAA